MIDKELIISKEEYIKADFIKSLNIILSKINDDNIDNSILEIKNKIDEFNILNENNIIIEESLINDNSLNNLINVVKNTKQYKLENTSFINLTPFIKDGLITIGAESSVGKTALATQLAIDILENNNDTILAFYSLDDSKMFIIKKIIGYLLNKHKNIAYTNTDKEFIENIKHNKDKSLHILTSSRIAIFEKLSIYSLYTEILKFKENVRKNLNIENPRLIIIIDYLQIIEHDSNNLREGLNKTCAYLKEIQKKLNCLLLLLSQFNRSKDTEVNTLVRYRETSEIENISDICINLENIRNEKEYNTKLYIVKNKAGEKDKEFISYRNAYTFDVFIENNKKNKMVNIDFKHNNYTISEDNIEDLIF